MHSKSETHKATNGATVEVGTIVLEGREFANLGSIIDEARGLIVGYISSDGKTLTTWDGAKIADVKVTGHARGFNGSKLTCYRMTYGGRTYHGRHGDMDLIRMRCKRAHPTREGGR